MLLFNKNLLKLIRNDLNSSFQPSMQLLGWTIFSLSKPQKPCAKPAGANSETLLFSDNMQLIESEDDNGEKILVSQSRNASIQLLDNKKNVLTTWKIPYGSKVYVKNNQKIDAGELLFSWDPYIIHGYLAIWTLPNLGSLQYPQ